MISLAVLPLVLLAGFLPAQPALANPPRAAELPPPGMFQLPFPIGETWTFNGVHGAHKEAIDFSVGRPWPRWRSDTSAIWVVAAAPGVIRRTSKCGLEIDHADGWTTVYYHIENIQRESGEVQANERLANIANTPREATCDGGHATAAHLHFELKHNGMPIPLDGLELSGWRIHSGRGRYDDNCKRMYFARGDEKRCAYDGPVTNEGIPSER
jgi:LasA protease